MTTLPLTVLVHEGPIARAYLAGLRHASYRPKAILSLLLQDRAAVRRSLLPASFVDAYRSRRAVDRNLHWPRWLRRHENYLYRDMVDKVGAAFDFPPEIFAEALDAPELQAYADDVQAMTVQSLKDPALARRLSALPAGEVLYTGGGIVPASLLGDSARPWLHVHPGLLPHVRGADGLLWSLLVRQRAGASCFHMVPGIDLGPVLAACEFAALSFSLGPRQRPDDRMLYRALFAFCDPYLRARTLIDHLRSRPAGGEWMAPAAQDPAVGTTYHFMHPALRCRVLRMLFCETR